MTFLCEKLVLHGPALLSLLNEKKIDEGTFILRSLFLEPK